MAKRTRRTTVLESMAASIDKSPQRAFRPAWVQSLATALLLPLFIALGFWQLQRAQEKQDLFSAEAAAEQATPRPVSGLVASPLPQHASATGRYDGHLFLLDNRVKKGHAGYEVLAPLRLSGGRAVLVNRGWVAQGASRSDLPEVSVPDETVTVTGLAFTPKSPPFDLSDRETFASGWPRVVQSEVPSRLAEVLDYRLLPVVLYPDDSAVAAQKVAALHGFPPARHRAYAWQWFAMAVVLVAVYLSHGFKRGRKS